MTSTLPLDRKVSRAAYTAVRSRPCVVPRLAIDSLVLRLHFPVSARFRPPSPTDSLPATSSWSSDTDSAVNTPSSSAMAPHTASTDDMSGAGGPRLGTRRAAAAAALANRQITQSSVQRELLCLRVEMVEAHGPGDRRIVEPEHVETLRDVRLVDEVVVPVRRPRAAELRRHERRRIAPRDRVRGRRVGEVDDPRPGLVVAEHEHVTAVWERNRVV